MLKGQYTQTAKHLTAFSPVHEKKILMEHEASALSTKWVR